ncbi:MAG: hypothetical protein HY934_03580 [Candidatus Firestonebacteria bacterium]|nr:hypothetical protein [Candidatus Firestonebacteria bacterium]
MIDFNEKLVNILEKVDCSIACIFTGLDGIGVANTVREERFESAVLDVELAGMLQNFIKVSKNLKLEKVDELVLKSGDVVFFLKMVGEEYFLGIVLNNDANLGRARLEIRKIISTFERDLYT